MSHDVAMDIISRDEAKDRGLKRYFTGVPCNLGHIAYRSVSSRSCSQCQAIYQKKAIQKHGLKPLTEKQKAESALKSRKYHAENREACLAKMRVRNANYYQKNKDRIKLQVAAYATGNKDIQEYKKRWQKEKALADPNFKMLLVMRRMLQRALGVSGQVKYKNTRDYLPYSSEELVSHLQSLFAEGMSWQNYGQWHIDHKRPISHLIKSGITDPAIINALGNLQPIWAKDNLSKGDKY